MTLGSTAEKKEEGSTEEGWGREGEDEVEEEEEEEEEDDEMGCEVEGGRSELFCEVDEVISGRMVLE